MESYNPPFQITNQMLLLISSISEKVGEVNHYKSLESKPYLRRNNRIRSIHSSLRIEANSLSFEEVKDVIDGKLVLGLQKEIQEVKNAYDSYNKLTEVNPYCIDDLKFIHGIMTRMLVIESGEFRKGDVGVFNEDKCIFMAPPAHSVNNLMSNLFSWMKQNSDSIHPLILSAVFHYEFVFIHPFFDGNSRMARLWYTVILAKWKPIFSYIPIESQIEKFQDGYYKAIADCHVLGDSNLFIEFMLKQIDIILDDTIRQVKSSHVEISKYVKRLLNIMEYHTPYTANSLMNKLNLKSKETFRKNYINPAMDMGLIAMTIPDKPQSRNQRYIYK